MEIDLFKFKSLVDKLRHIGYSFPVEDEICPTWFELVQAGLALQENEYYADSIWCFEQIVVNIDKGTLELEGNIKEIKSVALMEIAHNYVLRNQHHLAIEKLRQSLAIWPQNAIAYNILGEAYYDLHDFENSLDAHEKAVGINPAIHDSWNAMGLIMAEHSREYDQAAAYFDNALTYSEGENTYAWINKGNLLLEMNHPDEAITCYENAYRIDPQVNVHAMLNKASVLCNYKNNPEEALQLLHDVRKTIDKDHPDNAYLNRLCLQIKSKISGSGSSSLSKYFSRS